MSYVKRLGLAKKGKTEKKKRQKGGGTTQGVSPSLSSLSIPRSRVSVFQPEFREDLRYWVGQDARVAGRVLDLVDTIMDNPFKGIGLPEPLKYLGPNTWSRRVTQEHRIVYRVYDDRIDFIQCRLHY